ncbi:MAG: DUF4430 domain-containing protein [Candidatus Portnoybacteria bacterium]|nr:DUF4430 domain-containing protein [Candidatus Portnoybacteria bacterium]
MKKFFEKQKYSIYLLIVILIITVLSGYAAFFTGGGNTPYKEGERVKRAGERDINIPHTEQREQQREQFSLHPSLQIVENRAQVQEKPPAILATLIANQKTYQVGISENSSAYDLMKKASEQYEFSFNGKEYPGLGFFVETINGVKNNEKGDGKYWIYYINGEEAQAGISNYIVKSGDEILWKYEAME